MQGMVKVFYKVLCENDESLEVSLSDLLKHEAVIRAIKASYTSWKKGIVFKPEADVKILIEPERELYEMLIPKADIISMVELAEEDARSLKRFKKGCERVMIVDYTTEF